MSLRLHHVVLRTADLARSVAFYHGNLGLSVRYPAAGLAEFSAQPESPALLVVREEPGAQPPPPRAAGLFHTAFLLPDRASLAATLVRLIQHETAIQGLADHGVSEAIYLDDPDGNGVEIYRDRPQTEWPMDPDGKKVAMFTHRLNVDSVLAETPKPLPAQPMAGAILGHIHLSVRSLESSRDFYTRELGMDVMQDNFPGALFLAADGYHHHFGLNVWAGARLTVPARTTGLAGLVVSRSGTAATREVTDPDGTVVAIHPTG